MLLMGVFDMGRGIYMYNGVAQASREIARTTSVHPGSPLGSAAQTTAVVATQKKLIPGLSDPTISCADVDGSSVTTTCRAGYQVKVVISAPYQPVTPILGLLGTFNMEATSSVAIQ